MNNLCSHRCTVTPDGRFRHFMQDQDQPACHSMAESQNSGSARGQAPQHLPSHWVTSPHLLGISRPRAVP